MSHDEAKTDPPRDAVAQGVVITSQLVAERGVVEFSLRNGGAVPVWVPQEKQPSYRVDAAGKRIIIFSGGEAKDSDASVLDDIRAIRDGGGYGSIIGRNSFQRPFAQGKKLLEDIMDIYK